jgi:hypothetical protein
MRMRPGMLRKTAGMRRRRGLVGQGVVVMLPLPEARQHSTVPLTTSPTSPSAFSTDLTGTVVARMSRVSHEISGHEDSRDGLPRTPFHRVEEN